MNWITNFVRPKIRALVTKKDVPDNLWEKCPGCGTMLFKRELEDAFHVCRACGHHLRLDPLRRLEMLFDEGMYKLVPLPKVANDPLHFKDIKRYGDRLKDARRKTGQRDALFVGEGKMDGRPVVIAAFDFAFMGGSMGTAVGEGIVTAAQQAVAGKAPLVIVPASGGARMQEGILSLMQMPRTTIAVQQVKAAGLPYIVVLTDPTTGGVTASFAMLGDIHIAEKGAQIGFAGARVIENTIRETLPQDFQRAEYLKDHGMVDIVVTRKELRDTLIRIFSLLIPSESGKKKGKKGKGDVPALTSRS
jgi:acetyl-CoA carboxylase carboxyl transferase subunit beta